MANPGSGSADDGIPAEGTIGQQTGRPGFIVSSRMSSLSKAAMEQLQGTDAQLGSIEARVQEISAEVFQAQGNADCLGPLKVELAMLESQAKQLETVGVDDVYTGELNTGKVLAKTTKKEMLARLEVLFEKCDKTFAAIKSKTGS
eukprot:CAMPEP_0170608022 /NCGR_PEP_ID=MMETSP0224-20130122/21365_1 /TAXON_ID=285029 /ORGANISM="Togula jolla, Strain CCCM 725" /LENGTH=144 /DNA_ID=CAMNT_0010933225 /DNA_START=21 /DNA_END=455 /DNA_ORIENTATION=+